MRHIILILVLICSQLGYAQIDFEKGYFIDNQGNKKECYIRNMDWKNNPTSIVYKTTMQSNEEKQLSIDNLNEFQLNDIVKFVKASINLQNIDLSVDRLSNRNNNHTLYKTVLLRVLIEGKATLYSFNEGDVKVYFFKIQDDDIEQLVYKKFLDEKDRIVEFNSYKQQLKNGFATTSISDKEFTNLSYTASSLENIFSKYNNINNSNKVITTKNKDSNFYLRLFAGINSIKVIVDDPRELGYYDTKIKNKLFLSYGFEMEVLLPYGNKKWAFFSYPNYTYYKNEHDFVYNNKLIGNFNKDIQERLVLKVNNFELPVGIRHYLFLNKNSKISLDFAFVKSFSKTDFLFVDDFFILGNAGNNYSFGVGYNYKNKYSIGYKFNTEKELLSDYFDWSSRYSSQMLNFTYTIFKN